MTYDQKVLNDIVNIMQNVRNDQAMPAAAAGAGRQTTEQQPRPMSFQEFQAAQKGQRASQQVIAGLGSEAARREHIAQKAPSYEVVRNGMYSFAMENDPQKKASYAGQMKNLEQNAPYDYGRTYTVGEVEETLSVLTAYEA